MGQALAAGCTEQGRVVDTVTGVVTVICRPPATPKAGIFDSAIPTQEMQSNPEMRLPAKVTPFNLEEIISPLVIKGIYEMQRGQVELQGITIIPGQEDAALDFLQGILPPQIVLYTEATGEYRHNHPAVNLWLGSNLINVMLVERGFARPDVSKSRYTAAFARASAFAQEHHLGTYAGK